MLDKLPVEIHLALLEGTAKSNLHTLLAFSSINKHLRSLYTTPSIHDHLIRTFAHCFLPGKVFDACRIFTSFPTAKDAYESECNICHNGTEYPFDMLKKRSADIAKERNEGLSVARLKRMIVTHARIRFIAFYLQIHENQETEEEDQVGPNLSLDKNRDLKAEIHGLAQNLFDTATLESITQILRCSDKTCESSNWDVSRVLNHYAYMCMMHPAIKDIFTGLGGLDDVDQQTRIDFLRSEFELHSSAETVTLWGQLAAMSFDRLAKARLPRTLDSVLGYTPNPTPETIKRISRRMMITRQYAEEILSQAISVVWEDVYRLFRCMDEEKREKRADEFWRIFKRFRSLHLQFTWAEDLCTRPTA